MNGSADEPKGPERAPSTPVEEAKPARADPMSFSNILSSTTVESAKPVIKSEPPMKIFRRTSKPLNGDAATASAASSPVTTARKPARKVTPLKEEVVAKEVIKESSRAKAVLKPQPPKKTTATSDKENDRVKQALANIDAMEQSDLDRDPSEWGAAKEQHAQTSRKRLLVVEDSEKSKRKVCSKELVREQY